MGRAGKAFSPEWVSRSVCWLAAFSLVCLGSLSLYPQAEAPKKITVGILPFDDVTSAGVSEVNAAALARRLRAELVRSGKLSPRVLTLPADAVLPLEAEQAAEIGRAANVDLVIAITVMQLEVKQSEKGGRTGRSVYGVPLGGGQVKNVSAAVTLQAELIRCADAERDVFTVNTNKTESSGSGDFADMSSSTDVSSSSFQASPLGQALQEALGKMTKELEIRSPKAVSPAPAPPEETSALKTTAGRIA